jgi:hypothetical protein
MSFVRPALWGRGLNAWLLRLGEERARDKVHRAAAASPVFLRVSRWAENEAAGRLFACEAVREPLGRGRGPLGASRGHSGLRHARRPPRA